MQILDHDLLSGDYWGNNLFAWGAMILTVIVVLALIRLIEWALHRHLEKARETETQYDDLLLEAVERTNLWLLFFPVLFFSMRWVQLPAGAATLVRNIAIVAFLIQLGIWASALSMFWISRVQRSKMETDAAAATTISALGFVARIAIWSVVFLLALENLGFEIAPLVAGLGIGGIAVALAAQKVLGDLFASASIVIDKPFVIGDFIIVGDFLGTVEYIGLKTTRVRSLGGEQIIFSNSDLLDSRVRNYKRMLERRVLFGVGVTYQTPREKLEMIPQMIRGIVESVEGARMDRCHFKGFGAFSLDFETVYHVLDPDYGVYMDIQQKINIEIVRAFEGAGIEFAYPTQTLFLEKSGAAH